MTLCEAHHLAIHRGTLAYTGGEFVFAAANRFTTQSRIVETKRALERRGISRQAAAVAVEAVRARVRNEPLSTEDWLKLALEQLDVSAART